MRLIFQKLFMKTTDICMWNLFNFILSIYSQICIWHLILLKLLIKNQYCIIFILLYLIGIGLVGFSLCPIPAKSQLKFWITFQRWFSTRVFLHWSFLCFCELVTIFWGWIRNIWQRLQVFVWLAYKTWLTWRFELVWVIDTFVDIDSVGCDLAIKRQTTSLHTLPIEIILLLSNHRAFSLLPWGLLLLLLVNYLLNITKWLNA